MTTTTERRSLQVYGTLVVEFNNPPEDWITRVGTREWRDSFYDMEEAADVYEHLAYNAIANGVTDISVLDGWGDIERGAIRFHVEDLDFDNDW